MNHPVQIALGSCLAALLRLLPAIVVSILGASLPLNAQGVSHPMDALTQPEVAAAVRLAREAGLATAGSRFPVITLK